MKLNLKKNGRTTMTKSFSLTESSAEFIETYTEAQDCSASSFIDALVQGFKETQMKKGLK